MRRFAIALLLGLCGCVSFSNLQRADVLPKGKVQTGFAPVSLSFSTRGVEPEVPFLATVRGGLGHDWELSGRFWLLGAGVGAKYQFLHSERFVASAAPEVLLYALEGYGRGERGGLDFVLPVLVGINVDRHQVVLGARVVTRRWHVSSDADLATNATYPGLITGFDLVPVPGFHVMPEATWNWWPGGGQGFGTATLGLAADL